VSDTVIAIYVESEMSKRKNDKETKKIEKAQEDGLHAYAAELGKRYVVVFPEDPEGFWVLGLSLHQLDRYAEAKQALETAIPLCSSGFLAPVLSTLAEIYRDGGDFANAERLFAEAIEADPQEAETYLDLSWTLQVLNRNDEAEY
jgi:tetratricopeptide (TPR) repeat protein